MAGFLNTNPSPLSRARVSNYGLMDQMAALQWVRENAEEFGGDTGRVTLMGHGTGAACVEYLAHSPTTVPGTKEYPTGQSAFCPDETKVFRFFIFKVNHDD